MLSARRVREIKARLDAIPHVGALRIHTRVPVVAPERITGELVEVLGGRLPVHILIHANHAGNLPRRRGRRWRGWSMRAFRCSGNRCCCAASTIACRR